MNILITGITGSGGSYLAEYIVNKYPHINVNGLCRWHSTTTPHNIKFIEDKVHVHESDLLDLSSIIRVLQNIRPKIIFHLAAYANVRKCFDTPLSVVHNNVMGTANLLEAIRIVDKNIVTQICSTSEVYGNPEIFPMDENHPTNPVNPYAASKLSQESLAYAYYKSWEIPVVITRMFAYINPRRTDLFASAFAKQVVEIERGKRDVLLHGNLDSVRTLIDVRDAMESYWIAAWDCKCGTPYNIGGHDILSVGDFLEILKSKAKCKIESKCDDNLLRPIDVTKQIPNVDKFTKCTNWRPQYSLEESIDFLLSYYRSQS